MGMAFQSISVYNAPPVFQTLVANGAVKEASFSFKLADNGSELFIGGANTALYTGDFTYAPVVQQVSCSVFFSKSVVDWMSGILASQHGQRQCRRKESL